MTSLNYHQNVALNVLPGNKCTFYRDKNVQEIEDILTKEFSILCEFGNNFVDNKWSIYFEENPIQDAPPTSFSSVTSANTGVSPKSFLTFSFNPFASLV